MSTYHCIACKKSVSLGQQAFQCYCYDKWKYRTCNTGVSKQRYRDAVKIGINWHCIGYSIFDLVPVAKSTRVDNRASPMSFVCLTLPGSLILEMRDDFEANATDDAALCDTVDQSELESERNISYEIPPQIEES